MKAKKCILGLIFSGLVLIFVPGASSLAEAGNGSPEPQGDLFDCEDTTYFGFCINCSLMFNRGPYREMENYDCRRCVSGDCELNRTGELGSDASCSLQGSGKDGQSRYLKIGMSSDLLTELAEVMPRAVSLLVDSKGYLSLAHRDPSLNGVLDSPVVISSHLQTEEFARRLASRFEDPRAAYTMGVLNLLDEVPAGQNIHVYVDTRLESRKSSSNKEISLEEADAVTVTIRRLHYQAVPPSMLDEDGGHVHHLVTPPTAISQEVLLVRMDLGAQIKAKPEDGILMGRPYGGPENAVVREAFVTDFELVSQ